MEKRKILNIFVSLVGILAISYLAVFVRISTLNTPTVLDYDPFWFYRHAKEILENNFKVPKWDILSFYPPGRPREPFEGWAYTIVIIYKLMQFFDNEITLTKAAIFSPLIMAAIIPIPSFLLGRILTGNNLSGFFIALFATLSPAFIGVSMAGYCDSDSPVVFYSFLSVLFVIIALKKKTIPLYLLAILSNLMFVYNWGGGWITLILFLAFFPALIFFRILEDILHSRKIRLNFKSVFKELKDFFLPLAVILLGTNILSYILFKFTLFQSFLGGLAFTGLFGQPLLVNISVAELQPINIFSREGFFAVAGRVGLLPVLLTFFGLPSLVFYKIYKKELIGFEEIFLFLWALVMFYLITRGVRFSLLFSIASSVSAGYVIGNIYKYLIKGNVLIFSTVFGFIALFTIMFISDAIQIGNASSGMMLSQNWYDMLDWLKRNADKDSLIVTWWDPGHIIAGYTELKVHADGAHCTPQACIPYNHNIRIQDMGRIFSTKDEEEAVKILKKYKELTPQQCQSVREAFGDIVPSDACKPVSEMYVIASSDLIGKYYWMSYFGTGTGRNFFQLPLSGIDETQGTINYANGIVSLVRKEDKWVPIYQNRYIIKEIVYFEEGQMKQISFENVTNTIEGMVWVDPSYGLVIFMDSEIKDSIFTKMFFWNGKDLKHFKFVYGNQETKIFKVIF